MSDSTEPPVSPPSADGSVPEPHDNQRVARLHRSRLKELPDQPWVRVAIALTALTRLAVSLVRLFFDL